MNKDEIQSDALNKGFSNVTRDIIGWQNSDDVYLPGAFYEAVNALKKDLNIDIVFSNRLDVYEQDNLLVNSDLHHFH